MSLLDLLYGLMLPSGNDAALTLASNLGRLMRKELKRANIRKQRMSVASDADDC